MTISEAEIVAMRRALTLAVSSDAPLGPNPRVGCVLIDEAGRARTPWWRPAYGGW